MENILEAIRPMCLHLVPVGSRVTCNPPPTDTDADYLALALNPQCYDTMAAMLDDAGYLMGGSRPVNSMEIDAVFKSFKLGEINFILTEDTEFFKRFIAASSIAKALNLMEKTDRIDLFQAVLYGNPCSREFHVSGIY